MGEVERTELRPGLIISVNGIKLEVVDESPDGSGRGMWTGSEPVVTIRASATGKLIWQRTYSVGSYGANYLVASPQQDRALLVAGGVAHYINAEYHGESVELPIQDVSIVTPCSSSEWLIVASNLSLLVIGTMGPLWLLERLSWDGLQQLSIRQRTLVGHRWDVASDAWSGFQFDLLTGKLTGGILTPQTVTTVHRLSNAFRKAH